MSLINFKFIIISWGRSEHGKGTVSNKMCVVTEGLQSYEYSATANTKLFIQHYVFNSTLFIQFVQNPYKNEKNCIISSLAIIYDMYILHYYYMG